MCPSLRKIVSRKVRKERKGKTKKEETQEARNAISPAIKA
jgi:hypothetical protein